MPPHGDEEVGQVADIEEPSDANIPSQPARKMVPHESCGYDCQGKNMVLDINMGITYLIGTGILLFDLDILTRTGTVPVPVLRNQFI